MSIPSGLFSPPTEESTFDPRTQPTSLPLHLPSFHESPSSTLYFPSCIALFSPLTLNLMLLTRKRECIRSPSISASFPHRTSLSRVILTAATRDGGSISNAVRAQSVSLPLTRFSVTHAVTSIYFLFYSNDEEIKSFFSHAHLSTKLS